jgi:predicted RNA-binding Zn-ribbon protein involved in translation (DUF1610 family)
MADLITDEIINLESWKEENAPHNQGKARCMACGHEEETVAPTGVVWMECSACHAMKKLFIHDCQRYGKEWTCNCGNDLFRITPEGVYCPNCGDWQTDF